MPPPVTFSTGVMVTSSISIAPVAVTISLAVTIPLAVTLFKLTICT
jgi:hypothetical protein